MRLPRETYQIQQAIETHLPHLSQPQLTGLALWVCGAILAGSACQNAVASALSPWRKWNNLRQYLREWLYDGSDRTSPCQTQLDVTLCFAPLLRWVLAWWHSGRLALAIDPTLKGDQTTAIVISVVYRSCAIPVAWHIHRATQKGSWMDSHRGTAQGTGPGGSTRHDRHRALRPGHIQSQAVETDTRPGLAPLYALPGRTSPSAPTAANACPPAPSSPFPTPPGSGAAPPSGRQPLSAAAPCWWSGTPGRKNPGSSSPTWRPIRWDPVGTPCASGSSWASRPSRAWAGSGTRPGAPTQPASPATGWCCRWQLCWPWPMAPGSKTPRSAASPQATCARRPRLVAAKHRDPLEPSGTHRQRHPPRHRLAPAACCSGDASGPSSDCCPNPGRNPKRAWRLPITRPPKSPYLPL